MSVTRCGPLAAWTRAWAAGRVSLDDAVDALTGEDAPHHVEGMGTLHEVLVTWRRSGAEIRAVLPVPGDVRGLPGPAPWRAAALQAGEAVFAGGLGLVPTVREHDISSALTSVTWQPFACEPASPDHLDLAEAQYELTTAIRETAGALAAADVAGGRVEALPEARRAGDAPNLPPGSPPRAVALLAQAERLAAVLDLALADPAGGAVDAAGIRARTEALGPLATAVRRARLAAYNAR